MIDQFKICCFVVLLIISNACSEKNESPRFVGRPPQNAYTGLVKISDNDIRHYGKDCYIQSNDKGLTWHTISVKNGNLYGKESPLSGEFLRIYSGLNDSVFAIRSNGKIDGTWEKKQIDSNGAIMIKPAIFIRNGSRAISAFHTRHRNGCGTYYSDDDGHTWKKSNQVNAPDHNVGGLHKGKRWNHGAVEPTVIELNDDKLWMLIRTAQDQHYESFSNDGGETWSETQPSRFYGTITMPTLHRLSDGRILFLWSNTTPLTEVAHNGGFWEDVFSNRDAIHAAISDDDGKTWQGFRELYLNPLRNDSLMATRFGKMGSNDRSVHQSEIVESGDGEVLVSLGQHPEFRSLVKFNPDWLYEKKRSDDFSDGLSKWSVQKYIRGIEGHCAYNRKPGASVIKHPDKLDVSVMHLAAKFDSTLLAQNSGALFNFPAGHKGEVVFRIKFNNGFEGMRLSLHDRWFNPTDSTASNFAMYNFDFSVEQKINDGEWHEIRLKWSDTDSSKTGFCEVIIDGKCNNTLKQNFKTQNGISYIQFYLPLKSRVNNGVLIESIHAKIE
jgi:hypothetical protein